MSLKGSHVQIGTHWSSDLNIILRLSKTIKSALPLTPHFSSPAPSRHKMPLRLPRHLARLDVSAASQLRLFAVSRNKRIHYSIPSTPSSDTKTHFQFSPFDLLPVELQVEIFTHCLPPFPRFDVDEAPLLIARVCTAWKALVLSTPKLWSTFEIEITGTGSSVSLRDLQIMSTMKLWLKLSRNYPLNLRVIHVPVGRIPDLRSAQLLAILIPEARRWRHVQFVIPSANMASFREHMPNDFPMLQSLTLQMKGLWNSEPGPDIMTANIPWRQLTSLDLQLEQRSLLTLDECLEVLSQTESLKRCTLSTECTLDQGRVNRYVISLPMLEELHLNLQGGNNTQLLTMGRPEAYFIQFLGLLSFERLNTLELAWLVQARTDTPRIWSRTHSEFLSFLHQISPTLRNLTISYLPVSGTELAEYLAQVPKVTHLNLRFSLSDQLHDPITDSLLSSLSFRTPQPSDTTRRQSPHTDDVLLPSLEYLDVHCHGEAFTNLVLFAMIQSRWRRASRDASSSPNVKLAFFRLLSMKPVLGEVERRVKAWTRQGLDISIDNLNVR